MAIDLTSNPGLLKLALGLGGIAAGGGRASGDSLELVLDGEVWARAGVSPKAALKLIERDGSAFVTDGKSEVAVRVAMAPEFAGKACAFCLGRELTEKAGQIWEVDEVIEALRGAFDEGAAEAVHFQVGYFPGDDAGVQ